MPTWLAPFMTALKGFTAFWALLLLAVAAALQAKLNSEFGAGAVNATNLASANALIACCVFALLYFGAALTLLYKRPESIFISVMVDTIVVGFLFILALGGTAGESSEAAAFRYCSSYDYCSLGSATIGLGWIFTFLLLGILVTEVTIMLMHYGGSYATWRTPFHQLLHYGPPQKSTGGISNSTSAAAPGPGQTTTNYGNEAGHPMGSVNGYQPQMQQAPGTFSSSQAYQATPKEQPGQQHHTGSTAFPTAQPTGSPTPAVGYGELNPATATAPTAGHGSFANEKTGYAAAQHGSSDVRPLPNLPQ